MGLLAHGENPYASEKETGNLYWRIQQQNYNADTDTAYIVFAGYASKEARDEGALPVDHRDFTVESALEKLPPDAINQTRSAIYAYAKLLTFHDSQDVLETGQKE